VNKKGGTAGRLTCGFRPTVALFAAAALSRCFRAAGGAALRRQAFHGAGKPLEVQSDIASAPR